VETSKKIVTKLAELDMSQLDSKRTTDGKCMYKFDFSLDVILGHKQGTIAFRVRNMADNMVVGQTSVDLSE
jgi:hypothetical protein